MSYLKGDRYEGVGAISANRPAPRSAPGLDVSSRARGLVPKGRMPIKKTPPGRPFSEVEKRLPPMRYGIRTPGGARVTKGKGAGGSTGSTGCAPGDQKSEFGCLVKKVLGPGASAVNQYYVCPPNSTPYSDMWCLRSAPPKRIPGAKLADVRFKRELVKSSVVKSSDGGGSGGSGSGSSGGSSGGSSSGGGGGSSGGGEEAPLPEDAPTEAEPLMTAPPKPTPKSKLPLVLGGVGILALILLGTRG